MPKSIIRTLIERLFPNGTNPDPPDNSIASPPGWPPDLFAVAAAILSRTGGYWSLNRNAEKRVALDTSNLQDLIRTYGMFDAGTPDDKGFTSRQRRLFYRDWEKLLHDRAATFSSVSTDTIQAALRLALIADGASEFAGLRTNARSIARIIVESHRRLRRGERSSLPDPERSLCRMVPIEELRVLPKVLSSEVGQTISSLSRNLSVVENSEVDVRWLVGSTSEDVEYAAPDRLNLLLVPFPYEIETTAFRPSLAPPVKVLTDDRYCFDLKQTWLAGRRGGMGLSRFISELITAADRKGITIDGVVLPELAISQGAAKPISEALIKRHPRLKLFITGTGAGLRRGIAPINSSTAMVFNDGKVNLFWSQSKHHQWRLDEGQISLYGLNGQLNPVRDWWEDFEVRRECVFCLHDGGLAFTTLICEDIARAEPVLPIIRAVGPNLIIALLMDDSQLDFRWSALAAKSLASDPGSGVLTFTSLGLIKRSKHAGKLPAPVIARWYQRRGPRTGTEITIDEHAHAVVVQIVGTSNLRTELSLSKLAELKTSAPLR